MFTLTSAQLHVWLVAFLWPFVRLAGFIMVAPLLGHSSVPRMAKLGLAVLITIVVAPGLAPLPEVAVWSWAGLGIVVEQLLIGIALGMALHVVFAAIMAAGDFVGLQMGLAFATFVSPDTGANTMILARFFYMMSLLMFLALDGHLMVIETLAFSFQALPVGYAGLDVDGFNMLVRFGSTIFSAGLLLALPLVAALLIVNLSLGILNRSAPQMTVFSVGFPTSLTLGLFLLSVLMNDLGRYLETLFSRGIETLQMLIQALAPLP